MILKECKFDVMRRDEGIEDHGMWGKSQSAMRLTLVPACKV